MSTACVLCHYEYYISRERDVYHTSFSLTFSGSISSAIELELNLFGCLLHPRLAELFRTASQQNSGEILLSECPKCKSLSRTNICLINKQVRGRQRKKRFQAAAISLQCSTAAGFDISYHPALHKMQYFGTMIILLMLKQQDFADPTYLFMCMYIQYTHNIQPG